MAIRCVRGTQDVLAAEVSSWQFLESVALDLAHNHGYKEIRTPIFEPSELFLQGLGATAGLVERELWTFHDKHGRKLALRADMTAPVMRAYHEHELYKQAEGPLKLFYMGPVFLYGRGREVESRQVHQFGLEALGSGDAALDTEVLAMMNDFCVALGLPEVQIQLNSLGCKKCRAQYQQVLRDYFAGRQDELCQACKRRHSSHPLWTMGCDDPQCVSLAQVAPSIFGFLCTECREHFEAVKTYLRELKIDYVLNPRVVRDVEYYNRTIFKVTCAGHEVAFGGRYDELSQLLGYSSTCAVGCSLDVEPLLEVMADNGIGSVAFPEPAVLLAGEGREAVALLLPILYALRRNGILAELAYPSNGQSVADIGQHSRAKYVLLLKAEDVRSRMVEIHELEHRDSWEMRLDEAVAHLGRDLGIGRLAEELRPVAVRRPSVSHCQPVRSRSRVMYGSDVPRVSKTVRRRYEEPDRSEDRRRRRRRHLGTGLAGAERSVLSSAAAAPAPARASKRVAESSKRVAEVARELPVSPRERRLVSASVKVTATGRRCRRRHRESEDSLEIQAVCSSLTAGTTYLEPIIGSKTCQPEERANNQQPSEDSLNQIQRVEGLASDLAADINDGLAEGINTDVDPRFDSELDELSEFSADASYDQAIDGESTGDDSISSGELFTDDNAVAVGDEPIEPPVAGGQVSEDEYGFDEDPEPEIDIEDGRDVYVRASLAERTGIARSLPGRRISGRSENAYYRDAYDRSMHSDRRSRSWRNAGRGTERREEASAAGPGSSRQKAGQGREGERRYLGRTGGGREAVNRSGSGRYGRANGPGRRLSANDESAWSANNDDVELVTSPRELPVRQDYGRPGINDNRERAAAYDEHVEEPYLGNYAADDYRSSESPRRRGRRNGSSDRFTNGRASEQSRHDLVSSTDEVTDTARVGKRRCRRRSAPAEQVSGLENTSQAVEHSAQATEQPAQAAAKQPAALTSRHSRGQKSNRGQVSTEPSAASEPVAAEITTNVSAELPVSQGLSPKAAEEHKEAKNSRSSRGGADSKKSRTTAKRLRRKAEPASVVASGADGEPAMGAIRGSAETDAAQHERSDLASAKAVDAEPTSAELTHSREAAQSSAAPAKRTRRRRTAAAKPKS